MAHPRTPVLNRKSQVVLQTGQLHPPDDRAMAFTANVSNICNSLALPLLPHSVKLLSWKIFFCWTQKKKIKRHVRFHRIFVGARHSADGSARLFFTGQVPSFDRRTCNKFRNRLLKKKFEPANLNWFNFYILFIIKCSSMLQTAHMILHIFSLIQFYYIY